MKGICCCMNDDNKVAKTIIIIGNGFDLFLGLPTRFKDFISFCEKKESFYKNLTNNKSGVANFQFDKYFDNDKVIEITDDLLKNFPHIYNTDDSNTLIELKKLIDNSNLIKYCIDLKKNGNYNWSDFEQHITKICKNCEEYCNICSKEGFDITENDNYINSDLKILMKYLKIESKCFNFDDEFPHLKRTKNDFLPSSVLDSKICFIDALSKELNIFTKAFNIYIKCFVCHIPLQKPVSLKCINSPTYILNFNYTWSEQECFKNVRCCHIHGLTTDNNIVIGINDDKLPDEYLQLQKKFLSIKTKTNLMFNMDRDKMYYSLEEFMGECIAENVDYQVFVIGHSLNSIDDHILTSVFTNSRMHSIYLYCRNENSKNRLLANLYRILGYDKINSMVTSFPYIYYMKFDDLLN